MVLNQYPRAQDSPSLPENQEFIPQCNHVSTKIKTVNRVVLPAELQNRLVFIWVQFKTKRNENNLPLADILGEFILTKMGNLYLLTTANRFTKMIKTIPMKFFSVSEAARHFFYFNCRSLTENGFK